jgi:class 3 adenylate cyclase
MLAVLDDVGVDRAVVLGLGIATPLLFAATHPRRTEALVLFNTSARMRRADDYPEGAPNEAIDRELGRAATSRGGASGTYRFVGAPSMEGNSRFDQWCQRSQRLSSTPAHSLWRLRAFFDTDLRAVLPAIRVPTLVCQRDGSPDVRAQRSYVATHIEGARSVMLPGDDDVFFAGEPGPLLDAIEEFVTGRLPTHETERVLATVMFTDVVGSTSHAARAGDRRWRELLASHDAVLRTELERFRGREIKTTGDGVLATFDGPGRALRCATAIRDAVSSLGIDVRVGLHTGEIDLRGDDISGIAVHIAQRVEATAQAGEILVSRTVVDLVAGSGIAFIDRGAHQLKGVPGDWQLFALDS